MSTLMGCPLDLFLLICLRLRDHLHIVHSSEELLLGFVNVRECADSMTQQGHEFFDDAHYISWYLISCEGYH